ncbi:hypothetical protein [Absidia glauca]|uniref:G-protein coupled receptors family 2 profile 2 domain-containing protein n=1 Tax=Absidia glauca TaxID=4829 RepID=A0A168R659_ABSGL|nr:hypothetical protein [Absidia glauca]
MLSKLATILVVLVATVSSQNTTTQCIPYPSDGICAEYIKTPTYTQLGVNVTDQKYLAALPALKQAMGAIDPSCVDTYYRYACSSTYPNCQTNAGKTTLLAGCMSTCQEVERNCGLVFTLTNRTNLLPNCTTLSPITQAPLQSDDSCNLIPSTAVDSDAVFPVPTNTIYFVLPDKRSLCAAQGAILMFSSLATVLWCCALIVNLHLHTVWSSNFFTNRYFLLHLLCWGIPAAFMATALGMKKIQYEFANLCLVSLESIFNLFFYPMAAIVIPSFVLHMCTFMYIAKIAVREGIESDMSQSASNHSMGRKQRAVRHKHVIQAVHIQWRALLLAVIACLTVLFYWASPLPFDFFFFF